MKSAVKKIPVIGAMAGRLYRRYIRPVERFDDSASFWKNRYASGGHSGVGSFGRLAEFKAEVLNRFVKDEGIQSVIEFGCGDGRQVELAEYPSYLGLDISPDAIERCRRLFAEDATKQFKVIDEYADETADLTLSLDVIYHLVEDAVYESYMRQLFDAAERWVAVYSSNAEIQAVVPQVRHRVFTDWVAQHCPEWKLLAEIPNRYPYTHDYRTESFADFFIFAKTP